MTFNTLKMALYATYLTNLYGLKLKQVHTAQEKKALRTEYSLRLLKKLNISIKVLNKDLLPKEGQYLLVSNHRTIIDPLIVEIATQESTLFGHWIAKKELYNSFFFGLFARNAGTILLDRDAASMSGFFGDIKKCVQLGDSIYIFPEGTRNQDATKCLGEFKEGARLIAVKNRLDMLFVYIKDQADVVLKEAIKDNSIHRTIEIQIGGIYSYKDKTPLEELYKKDFNLLENA